MCVCLSEWYHQCIGYRNVLRPTPFQYHQPPINLNKTRRERRGERGRERRGKREGEREKGGEREREGEGERARESLRHG